MVKVWTCDWFDALLHMCRCVFVGETGLLDGRSATTHWIYAEALAQQFPAVKVDVDKLIIDDGDIVTAGGDGLDGPWIEAGGKNCWGRPSDTDCALSFDRSCWTRTKTLQQLYPKLHHGDAAVLKVQHWLQTKGAKGVSLETMTAKAGLEKRTLCGAFWPPLVYGLPNIANMYA